ncbi:MAG: hypothetical protein IJK35_08745 [Oscillospiraceae bacterium]|nr:hypothetical protein [Oscillospiraceae bacterium]
MAQRTVHAIFAQRLAASCGIGDRPRFLLGSLLPDAVVSKSERDASHYAFRGGGVHYYDFERFYRVFAGRMDDPLYLGYAMHLLEDDCYREFIYKTRRLRFRCEEEVRALHRDYHLLNPYLREKYRFENRLSLPEDFAAEPISRVARFDAEGLVRDYAADLSEQPSGSFTYLRPSLIEDFILRYLPTVEGELWAVLRGERLLRPADFAWSRADE